MSNENIIKVTGLAMMKVSPDTCRINITIGRVMETYDEAYEQGKRNLNAINAVVVEAGLSENDVKTHRFDVTEHTKPNYENGKYVGYIKDGYELCQKITIDLAINNSIVNDIAKGIGQSVPFVEVTLSHLIKEPRAYKMKVLASAVKDAAEKAEVIATALNCELGDIKEVVYGNDDYDGSFMCEMECKAAPGSIEPLNMNAAEEEIQDEVRVTWYIKNK